VISLRAKIALGFAAVALATAAAVSLATPSIVGRGFAQLASAQATDGGRGPGQGRGPGPMAGGYAQQVQDETERNLILVAIGAALVASLTGFAVATWMARPLHQLARASRAVASGDLARRSGLAERSDEFGEVGRSFDEMAVELQRSEDARRRFMQDAVHELRTPLTVIEGTAGAIEEGVFTPEPRQIRKIRDQTRLLGRIVEDLRTIGLAEAGELPMERRRVDLAELAKSSVAAFEARARSEAIDLVADVEPGCIVDADEDRLRQALAALTDNALRHTPRGGRVRLVGRRNGGMARIAVEDSGPGIAAEDLPRVFDRFYQADRARDRRTGTSGLGLSIVRALVAAHGGRTGAENRHEGGASVWLELAVAQGETEASR
jgi:two-component system sensor histidine kinase BaeS